MRAVDAPGSVGSPGSLRLEDLDRSGESRDASQEEADARRDEARRYDQQRIPSLGTDHGSISDESVRTTPERGGGAVDDLDYAPGPGSCPGTRLVPRPPSVYATPSSVKPSLDVVDEGDESEQDAEAEGDSAWRERELATPARYAQSLDMSRGALSRSGIAGSFASSPGMARGQTTAQSFLTPGSVFHSMQHLPADASPSVVPHLDISLGDVTAEMLNRPSPASQASVAETPKATTLGGGSILLQSTRKSLVQNILDSSTKSGRSSRRSARYSSGSSRTDEASPLGGASHRSMRLSVAGTPRSRADYDGSSDLSYVSVASSSDLTTDRRTTSSRFKGNVSVPSIMPSGSGDADGHANAVKIAKHLSGINRHLEDENKDLKTRLDVLEGYLMELGVVDEVDEGLRIDEERIADAIALLNKQQDASVAQDQQDGGQAQQMIERLTARVQELQAALSDKEEDLAKQAGQTDRSHLEGDQQKRDELAAEVESLRERLALTEQTFQERLQKHARDFEEIVNEKDAEIVLAEKAAGNQVDRLRMENDALTREKDRLRSVLDSDSHEEKESKLQAQVDALQRDVREREADNKRQADAAAALQQQLNDAEQRCQEANELGEDYKAQADRQASAAQAALAERDAKQTELDEAQERRLELVEEFDEQAQAHRQAQANADDSVRKLEATIQSQQARVSELEQALSREERRAGDLSREVAGAEQDISRLDQEIETLRSQLNNEKARHLAVRAELDAAKAELAPAARRSASPPGPGLAQSEATVAALRKDLAAAAETIERLQARRSSPSPRQHAEVEAKDRRIEQLSQEKAELFERLRALRVQLEAAQTIQRTPKYSSGSVIAAASPFSSAMPVNKRLLHLQTPKTPGIMKEVRLNYQCLR